VQTGFQALDGSDQIWCGRCHWNIIYIRGTLFSESELTPGEFLIALVLYADTLRSITQITALLSPCYKTLHDQIREVETAFCQGFPTVWERIFQTVDGPTQVDETQQVCSGSKAKSRRGRVSTAAARQREDGHAGREIGATK